MHQTKNLPQVQMMHNVTDHLVTMFSYQHPLIFREQLNRMFMEWNLSEEACDKDLRESCQLTLKMVNDFFQIFALEDPEEIVVFIKEMRKLKPESHE